jgi:predicted amidohydrolase
METAPGLAICDIDPAAVDDVRTRVPVLAHRRAIPVPA